MSEQINLPAPVPRYRRIVSYHECPLCEKPISGYRTTTEYAIGGMEIAEMSRTFQPCGCTATS